MSTEPKIIAKVLMMRAFDDPMAPAEEMQYDEAADRCSWHALEEFLSEILK